MRLPRFVGLVDLAVIVLVAVALVLPARARDAGPVVAEAPIRDALALAEARAEVSPHDGLALEQYGRLLGTAGLKDWAIEATVRGVERVGEAPSKWRALLAASVAYVDHIDVNEALDYANKALAACRTTPDACPEYERVRLEFYAGYLTAGVNSGINPRKDPVGFRNAGQGAVHQVQLKSTPPSR
jgi:hypothetical protein